MKNLLLSVLLSLLVLAVVACHPTKPNGTDSSPNKDEAITLSDSTQVEKVLRELEINLNTWNMLTNDVVTNGDAMINIEVRNGEIVKAVEENLDKLTPSQQERFQTLLTEYKKQQGE